jgi:hypothetical protein
MKQTGILLLILTLLLSSCLSNEEFENSYSFSGSNGVVVNLPVDGVDQYLLMVQTGYVYTIFYSPSIPDSIKKDQLQVLVSGFTNNDLKEIEYTDTTSGSNKKFNAATLQLTTIKRAQQDMVVRYGTSFGMCAGYCNRSMELSKGKLKYLFAPNDTTTNDTIRCQMVFDTDSTDLVLDFINKRSLYYLDHFYGCPDCADGGAEWIEVRHGIFYKRIVFEYMNEPEELTPLVTILRRYMQYSECAPE